MPGNISQFKKIIHPEVEMFEECLLLVQDDERMNSNRFKGMVAFYKCDFKRLESEYNRLFIVRLFEELGVDYDEADDQLKLEVAKEFVDALGVSIRKEFADVDVYIETIGEDGLDDEPLEFCVTFWQKHRNT